MAKDPSYPMYPQDFDMDTASWSPLAVGVYIRLLNYSWINGPIPEDTKLLSSIVRMDHGNFKKVWPMIATKWKKTNGLTTNTVYPLGDGIEKKTNDGLVNRRMEEERESRRLYKEKLSESGKLGYRIKQERSSQQ